MERKLEDLDDDLIVELDEVEDGIPDPSDDEVEDAERRIPEAPSTPDEEGNEWDGDDDADIQAARAPREEAPDDSPADDRDEQVAATMRAHNVERAELMWQRTLAQVDKIANERAMAEYAIGQANEKIEAAYQMLAAADENGDSNAKIQATRYLDELKSFRGQIEAAKANLPDPERVKAHGYQEAISVRDQAVQPVNRGAEVGVNLRARNPLAQEWAKQNGSWMKSNAKATDFVARQSQEMVNSGWAPTERGFYTELSRRVQTQFPALKVAKPTAGKAAPQRRPAAPVASSRPSGTASSGERQGSKTRIRLDAQQQAKMRRFNLDPQNAEHRKAYAETVLTRQSRERAQGAR